MITFIVPCMGRLAYLKQTLSFLAAQFSVVVVDWSCPDQSGDWLEKNLFSRTGQARVFRVEGQKFFNASGARNVGAGAGKKYFPQNDWVAFLDADMLIQPGFAQELENQCCANSYVQFMDGERKSGHCGFTCCLYKDFLRAVGFSTNICGWGYEDIQFREKLDILGLKPRYIPCSLAQHIEHDDELRTKFYPVQNKIESCMRNRQVLRLELDEFRAKHEKKGTA